MIQILQESMDFNDLNYWLDDLYSNSQLPSYLDLPIRFIISFTVKVKEIDRNNNVKIEDYNKYSQDLLNKNITFFKSYNIKRITFMLTSCDEQFPLYFTYNILNDTIREISIYRDLEPALSHQLELARLKNFDIQNIQCENNNIHMYLATSKESSKTSTDKRIFIRLIIRHNDLLSNHTSYDYMEKISELRFLEVLDQLEVVAGRLVLINLFLF